MLRRSETNFGNAGAVNNLIKDTPEHMHDVVLSCAFRLYTLSTLPSTGMCTLARGCGKIYVLPSLVWDGSFSVSLCCLSVSCQALATVSHLSRPATNHIWKRGELASTKLAEGTDPSSGSCSFYDEGVRTAGSSPAVAHIVCVVLSSPPQGGAHTVRDVVPEQCLDETTKLIPFSWFFFVLLSPTDAAAGRCSD
jgi:hypothetical protein